MRNCSIVMIVVANRVAGSRQRMQAGTAEATAVAAEAATPGRPALLTWPHCTAAVLQHCSTTLHVKSVVRFGLIEPTYVVFGVEQLD